MAHFAQIDENNIVTQVLVVPDDVVSFGNQYLSQTLGFGGRWIQTSYNTKGGVHSMGGTPIRKNYAGQGMIYDENLDAFYAPRPFPSWTLDTTTCLWEAPVPMPIEEGKVFAWDEDSLSWNEV